MFFKNKQKVIIKDSFTSADKDFVKALNLFCATISFSPNGKILDANPHFLNATGYTLEEVKGKHHSIFCTKDVVSSAEYRDFWPTLASGQSLSGSFLRKRKNGEDLWIEATYIPVHHDGKVIKIVRIASDVTEAKKSRCAISHC